jgi:DNA polymerase I
LVDGSSVIFRAFYAIKQLITADGQHINAIYGSLNMIRRLQTRFSQCVIVFVFDAKEKTVRHKLYPAYKATRLSMPANLAAQIPIIHMIISLLGMPVIIESGIEADDIIATIASYYATQGHHVIIASSDKDFAQLVSPLIRLFDFKTDKILDRTDIIAKFGVNPEQIVDYLTLVGDKSDNIPGLARCGTKTAQQLLSRYNSLDNIIANQDNLTCQMRHNVHNSVAWLSLAKTLITLNSHVVLDYPFKMIENLYPQSLQQAPLIALLKQLSLCPSVDLFCDELLVSPSLD